MTASASGSSSCQIPCLLFHFGYQQARVGHEEAARFDFQVHGMAQVRLDLLARRIPQLEVVVRVDGLLAFAVRHGQAAARGNGFDVVSHVLDQVDHGAADGFQVAVVDARADVHVQAYQVQAMRADDGQRLRQFFVPDTVLAVFAARVGLVAVAMAIAGIDAQPDAVAG